MNIQQADRGHVNPDFNLSDAEDLGYRHNCQTCTAVYELRRRGYVIEAMPAPRKGRDFWDWWESKGLNDEHRFLNADGTPAKYNYAVGAYASKTKEAFLEKYTVETGRYEVRCDWKQTYGGGAHVFILERQQNGNLLWYDPQSGKKAEEIRSIYLEKMSASGLGIRRIDDKLINTELAPRFRKLVK